MHRRAISGSFFEAMFYTHNLTPNSSEPLVDQYGLLVPNRSRFNVLLDVLGAILPCKKLAFEVRSDTLWSDASLLPNFNCEVLEVIMISFSHLCVADMLYTPLIGFIE